MSITSSAPSSTLCASCCFQSLYSSSTSTSREGTPRTPVFNLFKSPETPIEDISQGIACNKEEEYKNMISPFAVVCGNRVYSVGHVRGMADVLERARACAEFPHSTSSQLDPQFIIEDYSSLCQLRTLRGDLSQPATKKYQELLIEITRRIRDRDEDFNDETKKSEATRRVTSFMQNIGYEKRCFDAASAVLQRRGAADSQVSQLDLNSVGEEITALVEHVVEQTMADASLPLRRNLGKFEGHAADLEVQNDTYGRQLDLHYRNIEQHAERQSETIKSLNALMHPLSAMFEPQTKNMQSTTENLFHSNGLVDNLSQIVTNLPGTINTAVQQQAQMAFKDIVQSQETVMRALEEHLKSKGKTLETKQEDDSPKSERRQFIDMDALAASIVKHQRLTKEKRRKGSGKLSKVFKKVLKF